MAPHRTAHCARYGEPALWCQPRKQMPSRCLLEMLPPLLLSAFISKPADFLPFLIELKMFRFSRLPPAPALGSNAAGSWDARGAYGQSKGLGAAWYLRATVVLRFFLAVAVKRYKPANLQKYRLKPAKSPLEPGRSSCGAVIPPFPSRPVPFFQESLGSPVPPGAAPPPALPRARPAAARPPRPPSRRRPCVCLGGAVSHSSDLMQL